MKNRWSLSKRAWEASRHTIIYTYTYTHTPHTHTYILTQTGKTARVYPSAHAKLRDRP